MKRSENEIDNLFQTKVDQFEMDPPKKAWTSLDAELDKKQAVLYKRKAFYYKSISIGLSLLLGSFIAFQYFVPHNYSNNSNTDLLSTNDINSINSASEHADKTDGKTNSNKHYKKTANNNKTLISSNKNEVFVNINRKQNNSVTDEKIIEGVNTPVNNHSASIVSSKGKKTKNTIVSNTIAPANDGLQASKESEASFISKGNDVQNDTIKNLQTSNSIPFGQEKVLTDPVKVDSLNTISLAKNASADSSIQKENLAKLILAATKSVDSSKINSTINPVQKNSFNLSKFAISAFFSPDFNYHHLIDDHDADDNKVPQQHKDHSNAKDDEKLESPDFSYTTGVLLKYDLTNKWSLQSGCVYSSSVRKIKPSTIYAEEGNDSEAHYLLNTSLGTSELPNSTMSIPQVGDSVNLKKDSKQILHFINIPLIVRYQFVKNRFCYYAYSGLSANILIKEQSEVTIENPTSETVRINNITGLKKITYSFLLGIGIQYNLYKGISIFTEPVFRRSITSINQNTPVTSYPYSIGFNTGLTYHF